MMTSLFTGVSGMQANQTYLDVISNNVSNSNTVGYKAEQVTFRRFLTKPLAAPLLQMQAVLMVEPTLCKWA